MMMRLEGWEKRLAAVIAAARARPYAIGEHDCFRVACQVVEALTGEDRWRLFAGAYASEREALRLLARYGETFEDAGDWFFGSRRVDVKLARRGDLLAYTDAAGAKHLGVCLGAQAAVPGPLGLKHVPVLHCACAWRVG